MVIRDTNCGNVDGGELLERNIIAQSINTGHDVANIQFDLQGWQDTVHTHNTRYEGHLVNVKGHLDKIVRQLGTKELFLAGSWSQFHGVPDDRYFVYVLPYQSTVIA